MQLDEIRQFKEKLSDVFWKTGIDSMWCTADCKNYSLMVVYRSEAHKAQFLRYIATLEITDPIRMAFESVERRDEAFRFRFFGTLYTREI